jgi:hypothetical protein
MRLLPPPVLLSVLLRRCDGLHAGVVARPCEHFNDERCAVGTLLGTRAQAHPEACTTVGGLAVLANRATRMMQVDQRLVGLDDALTVHKMGARKGTWPQSSSSSDNAHVSCAFLSHPQTVAAGSRTRGNRRSPEAGGPQCQSHFAVCLAAARLRDKHTANGDKYAASSHTKSSFQHRHARDVSTAYGATRRSKLVIVDSATAKVGPER